MYMYVCIYVYIYIYIHIMTQYSMFAVPGVARLRRRPSRPGGSHRGRPSRSSLVWSKLD